MDAHIVFAPKAWAEWNELIHLAPGEISVMGFVQQQGQAFIITDVHLIKQTNSSSHTEIDPTALALFLSRMRKEGRDLGTLKAWIHSHGNMQVFWSNTDEQNIKSLGTTADYLISVVSNKEGKHRGRLDVFKPTHLFIDELSITVDTGMTKEDKDRIAAQFKELTEDVRMPASFEQVDYGQDDFYQNGLFEEEAWRDDEPVGDAPSSPTLDRIRQDHKHERLDRVDREISQLEFALANGKISKGQYERRYEELVKQFNLISAEEEGSPR